MPTGTERTIDRARDSAQQMVTALLHDDRDLAGQIAQEHPNPLMLALVLGDLVAYVHRKWSDALGAPAIEGWQAIMADVEDWRTSRGATS